MKEFIRKRLAELLDASGIPPSRLSEILYLNPGYFSDVRRGKQMVSYEVLAQVCNCCNTPLSVFFDPDAPLTGPYREAVQLCKRIPEDQMRVVILPVLKRFAEPEQ